MQALRATGQVEDLLNGLLSHRHDHAMRVTHGQTRNLGNSDEMVRKGIANSGLTMEA